MHIVVEINVRIYSLMLETVPKSYKLLDTKAKRLPSWADSQPENKIKTVPLCDKEFGFSLS